MDLTIPWSEFTPSILSFLERITPAFTLRRVEYETLAFGPAVARRVKATVSLDLEGGCYRAFLSDRLEGWDLLKSGLHELRHVALGDVEHEIPLLELHRAALRGEACGNASKATVSEYTGVLWPAVREPDPAHEAHEAEVDGWAVQQADWIWPILSEALASAAQDAAGPILAKIGGR